MRLEPGEQVMVRTRTHPRALLRPAAVLVTVAFLLGLAMGVLARPDLPGIDLPGVHELRGLADAARLRAMAEGRIAPPLVITGEQVDWALEQFEAVLRT